MKSKSQLRDSIIAIVLLTIAVVIGLSHQAVIPAGAESVETKKGNQTKAGAEKGGKAKGEKGGNGNQNSLPRTLGAGGEETGANSNSNNRSGLGTNSSSAALEGIERNLKALDEKSIKRDDLWPLDILVNPIGLGLIVLALILGLLLHFVHFIRLSSINSKLKRIADIQNTFIQRTNLGPPVNPAPAGSAMNPAVDKIAGQVQQLQQSLKDLSGRCNQIANDVTISDSQYRDAVQAVGLAANWIGQTQLEATMAANGGDISESQRAEAIAMFKRYREPLRANANRVEPITNALGDLSERLQYRSHSSPQVAGRIQNLYDGIAQFDQQLNQVTTELESLQRGSFAERSARLQADQDRLFDQVNNGSLSVGQMVQQSRSLIERHFPAEQKSRNDENLSLEEQEANFKKGIDDAGDYLMDWYNNLFQLQAQLCQIQGSQADAETAAELVKIQQLAREALNRFDIQPEVIEIGQTSFDRRLHEATLVRPAPQYPINTVIDVQKCGFRRMTTGEVLRRPEVVVAGTAG